ncbi:TIGR04283 family arsenosugar biosynthesis glycosyltransferase [Desulfobacterales bacterium RS19-109]|jgi:rSAM/selenodomain-associated transferase 2|uniref:TIGR04283 family arsenosugar biosynthesis glycosyltransferase n=1 Tax=Thiovibrio frasassiensis TaxID=2984131 RepID=A0A9X4MG73_9BACT|nr:TIGR04283 family arsenosugar biosynthesis glycosyltransferase [Thiovibrio frasassiensis]MDG4475285.1 TIGR04283 family arsenosugar biosynthesis glycosyltransferase [Thiovibrio frasassiensis]
MSTARKTCDISIIIPTLNEALCLGQTVAGLVGLPGVEVIVADGGSQDRTVAEATAAGARVISAPLGRGSQQNAGARAANGRMLLFLHADTRLPKGFVAQIRAALDHPGIVAGAFRFAIDATGWRFRLLEQCTNWRAAWFGLPYGDQALFLPASRFLAMGGFRELPLLEDVELVLRLRKIGKIALLSAPASTSARRWKRLGLVRTTVVNQLILFGFYCGIKPERLARWYHRGGKINGRLSGKEMTLQILVRDKGKQKGGTFGKIGRSQGTGDQRVGIRQQPGDHHEKNGGQHPRLDQTENPAHKAIKPTEQGNAHHLFEHKTQGENAHKYREKQQGVGHEETELGRGNQRGKTRADLLVIAPGKKVAENERGQGGQLPDKADPYAADKKEEKDGDDAEIDCGHD